MPNYLGIDYGEKRVGLAFGDELGIATPMPAAVEPAQKDRLEHIRAVCERRRVDQIIIGYPLNMDGTAGFKAKEVDAFIEKLSKLVDLPLEKVDERLTSVEAANRMRAGGKKTPRKAKERQAFRRSGQLDSRAATIILQDYLDRVYSNGPLLLDEEDEPVA